MESALDEDETATMTPSRKQDGIEGYSVRYHGDEHRK